MSPDCNLMTQWACGESADVNVLPGKRCFAAESSPGSGCHILGRLGPSDPSLVLPQASSSLPLIYATFPEVLLADALDTTNPEGSCQTTTRSWCPSGQTAALWGDDGLRRRKTGTGVFSINCHQQGRRGLMPTRVCNCTHTHTHTLHPGLVGWACCLLTQQETSWLTTFQHLDCLFLCLFYLFFFFILKGADHPNYK